MTAASLADLGYQVDLDAAEPYTLPPAGPAGSSLRGHAGRFAVGRPLPVVLPASALRRPYPPGASFVGPPSPEA